VWKPVVDIVFASDLISFEDWIAQLSLSRSLPLTGICARQLMEKITNRVKAETIRVFISLLLMVMKNEYFMINKVSQFN
jgi:hypothetical protein